MTLKAVQADYAVGFSYADKKKKPPDAVPPDHPSVPPNRKTPPFIDDPKPKKPKKVV